MGGRAGELTVPISTSAVCCLLLLWWFASAGGESVVMRVAGQDGLVLPPAVQIASVQVSAGEPIRGEGRPSDIRGQWSGFRGDNRDGVVRNSVELARSWPVGGPPEVWSVELGEGYAGAAVRDGCVYVLDYDDGAAADTLRCISLADGREIWRNGYPVTLTRNHGMSRTVPAIFDDHVITIGPRCHVACWDAKTGHSRWLIDLARDHGTTEPSWYAGQCPLVDQGRLILAPCGRALLIAVDTRTGNVIWESPNPRGWNMTHASIMVMQQHGRRSYLYCGSGGIAAVAADDGSLLWDSTEWPTIFATCPSPLVLPEGHVFLCSGYGRTVGSLMLKVQRSGDQFSVETTFALEPREFNSEHHTPIFDGEHIYGVRKRGGGQMVCLDLAGKEVWNSGKDRFGHGPYLIADGLIFVMDDQGQLTMAEATPDQYTRLGHHQVLPDAHDAWGPMALVEGRLILRDMTRMTCIDIARR